MGLFLTHHRCLSIRPAVPGIPDDAERRQVQNGGRDAKFFTFVGKIFYIYSEESVFLEKATFKSLL